MVRGARTWCQATWFAKGRRLHARFPPPTGKISTRLPSLVHNLGSPLGRRIALISLLLRLPVTYLGAIAYIPATFVCPVSMFSNFCLQYGSFCCSANTVFRLSSVLDMPLGFQRCHSGLVAAVCRVKQSAFTCFFHASA